MIIQLIDYNVGNKKSIVNALNVLGHSVEMVSLPDEVDPTRPIVLPGVGSFAYCKEKLSERGLFDRLRYLLNHERPVAFMGICVGMQLLFESSVEDGVNEGFGYFDGQVVDLRQASAVRTNVLPRFPNTHWEPVVDNANGQERGRYYFTHSFGNLGSSDCSAVYHLGELAITATASRGPVVAFQFHPEKSATAGLSLLGKTLDEAGGRT